jgi:peroxisome-assembly ATPase
MFSALACYESKTKLFALSEVPIYQIFSDEASKGDDKRVTDHMRSIMDDLVKFLIAEALVMYSHILQGLKDQIAVGASSIFSGEEEVFAFQRACSRLVQMGTKDWAETADTGYHLKHPDNQWH